MLCIHCAACSPGNLSSYIKSSPPLYVRTYSFLIYKARKIILFSNLVFLIHSIKISCCVIQYSSTESFITVAWCFIAGRFRASQTGVCVPLRAKPQYKYSIFSWSINLIQSFGRGKKHIILISKQVQTYHSLEQRAPMNFKIKQPSSRWGELIVYSPKTHVPCPLRMKGTSEKRWVLVQAPLFTDQAAETQGDSVCVAEPGRVAPGRVSLPAFHIWRLPPMDCFWRGWGWKPCHLSNQPSLCLSIVETFGFLHDLSW